MLNIYSCNLYVSYLCRFFFSKSREIFLTQINIMLVINVKVASLIFFLSDIQGFVVVCYNFYGAYLVLYYIFF